MQKTHRLIFRPIRYLGECASLSVVSRGLAGHDSAPNWSGQCHISPQTFLLCTLFARVHTCTPLAPVPCRLDDAAAVFTCRSNALPFWQLITLADSFHGLATPAKGHRLAALTQNTRTASDRNQSPAHQAGTKLRFRKFHPSKQTVAYHLNRVSFYLKADQ